MNRSINKSTKAAPKYVIDLTIDDTGDNGNNVVIKHPSTQPIDLTDSRDEEEIRTHVAPVTHFAKRNRNRAPSIHEISDDEEPDNAVGRLTTEVQNIPSNSGYTTKHIHSQSHATTKQQLSVSQPPLNPQHGQRIRAQQIPSRLKSSSPENTSRSIQACDECKSTNNGCDGEQPCNHCLIGLDCTYLEAQQSDLPDYIKSDHRFESPIVTQQLLKAEEKFKEFLHSAAKVNNETDQSAVLSTASECMPSQLKVQADVPVSHLNPESFQDVLNLVSRTKENLDKAREYWLQGELQRFVASARATDAGSPCKTRVNPWRKYLASLDTNGAVPKADGHITVQMKTQGSSWKSTKLSFQYLDTDRSLPMLPKYRSYGTLGPSILARNVHTLQAIPYFPDEEELSDNEIELQRREDLATAYRNWDGQSEKVSSEFEKQRKCLEKANRWHVAFQQLISTLNIDHDQIRKFAEVYSEKCKTCELKYDQSQALGSDVTLDTVQLAKLRWLSMAMSQTGLTMWHFVDSRRSNPQSLTKDSIADDRPQFERSLCAICLLHNCLVHGSYDDTFPSALKERVLIDDAEEQHNRRQQVLTDPRPRAEQHICGVYCHHELYSTMKLRDIIGINENHEWAGSANEKGFNSSNPGDLKMKEPCSTSCYKYKANRTGLVAALAANEAILSVHDERQIKVLRRTMDLYRNRLDLPCLIAKRLENSCGMAFRLMLAVYQVYPPQKEVPQRKERAKDYDTRLANFLDKRPPIFPCSHEGPCKGNNNCSCAASKVHCERFCGCAQNCGRRFRGCTCDGACFRDNRCACWAQNRECDPWLCQCGVLEVLDPSNKYNVKVREAKKCCKNNRLQLGIPARTVKAESDVQGWGLFAGADIPKWTFVGEYKGEIVSDEEGKRRGIVYHNVGQEYLFDFNTQQSLDGSMFANKTRFMNNSTNNKYINIIAHKLIANSVTRVMFYTKRAVSAGEELLYNYNYPKEVQARFWEKGAKSTGNTLIPIPKPRLAGIGSRTARRTSDADEEKPEVKANNGKQKADDTVKSGKRKRLLVEDAEDSAILPETGSDIEADTDSESRSIESDGGSNDVEEQDRSSSYDGSSSEVEEEEDEEEEQEVESRSRSQARSEPSLGGIFISRQDASNGRPGTSGVTAAKSPAAQKTDVGHRKLLKKTTKIPRQKTK